MVAAFGGPRVTVGVVEQRGEVAVTDDDDIATAPTFAAVGATHGNELLATERRGPATSGACFDPNDNSI